MHTISFRPDEDHMPVIERTIAVLRWSFRPSGPRILLIPYPPRNANVASQPDLVRHPSRKRAPSGPLSSLGIVN